MTDQATPRPQPVLRKEVVATATWGEIVVRQLLASARVTLTAGSALPPEGETDEQRSERLVRDYARFVAKLMAAAIVDKAGVPMYDADQWDAWNATHGDECLTLADKALAMNGYRTLSGEDAAKNA